MVILAFRTADLAVSGAGRAAGTDNVVRAVNVVRHGNVGRHVNVVRHVNGQGKHAVLDVRTAVFGRFCRRGTRPVPVARSASVRVPWHVRQGKHGVFGVRTALFGLIWGPSAGTFGQRGDGPF